MKAMKVIDGQLCEKDWQRLVTDCATIYGWAWWHQPDSRRTQAGIPDLLLIRETAQGVDVLWAELKRQKGKLTARQEEVISLLIRGGHEVHVWRPSDWPKVEARLK